VPVAHCAHCELESLVQATCETHDSIGVHATQMEPPDGCGTLK
jgi:hypothetical protein